MPSIADLIERNRESLLQHYLEEASRLPSAREVCPQDVIDNLPEYLDTLCALSRGQRGDPDYTRRRLEETHLRLRLQLGYTLEDVRTELVLLERLLAGLWVSLPPGQRPTPEDIQLIRNGLQAAMAHAVSFLSEYSPKNRQGAHRTEAPRVSEEHLRRAVEAAAEHEKQQVTSILESISEAFLSFDRDWRFTYVNHEAERFMGLTREQVLGRDHWEVFPATLGTNVEHYYRRVATERIPLAFENYYAPWNRWFEFHAYPTEQGIAVYCQDITERKNRAEEREQYLREQTRLREQAERALRLSQRAEEVLEHGDPFILLDKDFRILQVNKNQELVSKKPREETLGRVIWDVFPAINNPESAYWREYRRAMKERVPVHFEEYYPPQDLWASVNAYPTAEGGLAVFLRDVTERKRAEQFRERLMGIVSHDLRSPLNSITLAAGILLRQEDLSEPIRGRVRRIVQSAERMSRMITDLLDFTRARLGGGIPLHRRPGELLGLVRTTLEEFEVTHPGRLVFSHNQGPYTGEWDLDRLAQVISNLVGNALKHGAGNTPVEVDLHEEGQEIILTVMNQGTPIPDPLLPHVFDPFRRAADSSRQGGLGLGLYIAQQIVLAHGGSITASSSSATGTTFTVRLPRERA
ncbi:PAS domain-containing sensor histidine kinase [Archangium violaceum]|uniref:sensor histidine kinase n=1 Tax=Archangium violaceum TaxID=83451 RepID=UPI0019510568|nr:PAS domain-containing sensor histidine kinase [Archangium violaceum]QRO00679.1 PAS domain-containing sensor histidine kinase [Archangium violaceum]